MTEEQFQQLLALLAQMGQDAHRAALDRAYVGATLDLIGWSVVMVVTIFSMRGVWRWSSRQLDNLDSDFSPNDNVNVKAATLVVGGFILFLVFCAAESALTDLLAPHYRALELLSQLVIGQ